MYMDIRYEAGSDADMPDLQLVDMTGTSTSSDINTPATFGKLCTLYAWHQQDPVDSFEQNRNNIIYQYQGNQNPFIDHPEWVQAIYGSACAAASNTAPVADDMNVTVAEDSTVTLNTSGTDDDGDTLSFAIAIQPTNGSVDTSGAEWTYTPNADFNGTDSITYTANDGFVSSPTATISITVSAVADAPVISGTPDSTVRVDGTYSFTPSVSDADNDTVSFSISDISVYPWLSFDTDSGILTGAPQLGDEGTVENIVITVTDDSNDALSDTLPAFSIFVAPPFSGANIVINEFLADPASDSAGDAWQAPQIQPMMNLLNFTITTVKRLISVVGQSVMAMVYVIPLLRVQPLQVLVV